MLVAPLYGIVHLLLHVPFDHRFFVMSGRKRSFNEHSKSSPSVESQPPLESQIVSVKMSSPIKRFHVYCDLDGVLVDFEAGVRKLFNGKGTKSVQTHSMWAAITKADAFYKNLSWTEDGKELWEAIRCLSPDILTGVAMFQQSRQDKYEWCKRELNVDNIEHLDMAGPKQTWKCMKGTRIDKSLHSTGGDKPTQISVNVITCWSKLKHMESGVDAVLIDDREDLAEAWEKRGGIFIHHTSTARTLTLLREKNIID
jgi:hypothetical protein